MKILPTNSERDEEGAFSTITFTEYPAKGWLSYCYANTYNNPDNCWNGAQHHGIVLNYEYNTATVIFFWYVTTDVNEPISEEMDGWMNTKFGWTDGYDC